MDDDEWLLSLRDTVYLGLIDISESTPVWNEQGRARELILRGLEMAYREGEKRGKYGQGR